MEERRKLDPAKQAAIDRIQHLLKYDKKSNASQGEMDAAAEMIRKILDANDLSLLDVEQKTIQDDVTPLDCNTEWKSRPLWATRLASDIASALDCRLIISHWFDAKDHGYKVKFMFIGYITDAQAATYFYEYLSQRLRDLSWDSAVEKGVKGPARFNYRQNFMIGASHEIYQRLKRKEEPVGEYMDRKNALVCVKKAAVDAKVHEMFPRLSSAGGSSVRSNYTGRTEGAAAGRTIPLNRGVSNGSNGGSKLCLGHK